MLIKFFFELCMCLASMLSKAINIKKKDKNSCD